MFRSAALLFVTLFTISACAVVSNTSGIYEGNAESGSIAAFSRDAIRLRHTDSVNALRLEKGLPPLQLSAALNAAAETHARDMAQQQRAWDFGSDRSSPQTRAIRAGFAGGVTGENVAETFKGEFYVLQAWLENPMSRQTILDRDATHVGFGWYQESNGKLWWVEVLGKSTPPLVMAQQ